MPSALLNKRKFSYLALGRMRQNDSYQCTVAVLALMEPRVFLLVAQWSRMPDPDSTSYLWDDFEWLERSDQRKSEKEKNVLVLTAAPYTTRVPETRMKCKHPFVLHERSSCDRYRRHNQQQNSQNSGLKNGKNINSNDTISRFASRSISFRKLSTNVENSQEENKYNRKMHRTVNFSV